jgi:hypothetical protein
MARDPLRALPKPRFSWRKHIHIASYCRAAIAPRRRSTKRGSQCAAQWGLNLVFEVGLSSLTPEIG